VLADEMGLGKTLQIICAASARTEPRTRSVACCGARHPT
jgi:SNF2 family DNA or RNA helicase